MPRAGAPAASAARPARRPASPAGDFAPVRPRRTVPRSRHAPGLPSRRRRAGERAVAHELRDRLSGRRSVYTRACRRCRSARARAFGDRLLRRRARRRRPAARGALRRSRGGARSCPRADGGANDVPNWLPAGRPGAALVHLAAVAALPRAIMSRVLSGASPRRGTSAPSARDALGTTRRTSSTTPRSLGDSTTRRPSRPLRLVPGPMTTRAIVAPPALRSFTAKKLSLFAAKPSATELPAIDAARARPRAEPLPWVRPAAPRPGAAAPGSAFEAASEFRPTETGALRRHPILEPEDRWS